MQHPTHSNPPSATSPIKPAPLRVALPLFAATSSLFFLALYLVLPALRNRGVSWFTIYNVVLALPMLLLVCASFTAYRVEGRAFTWAGIRDRFRLWPMDTSGYIWTAALSVFMFGGHYALYLSFALSLAAILLENRHTPRKAPLSLLYLALFLLASWLIWQSQPVLGRIPLHAEPAGLRDFFAQFASTSFMGIPLRGKWWIPVYYVAVLLVGNIAGEELWWRGYLLPRQELAHGKWTWLIHGILWAAFHLFFQTTLWEMVRMFPTCCALAFVAQHKKNTWPGIFGHTFGNSGFLLQILHGVAGL